MAPDEASAPGSSTSRHPAVYVSDVRLPRRIERAASGIAAFAGSAARGPVAEPVRIHGLAEFEESFGAPAPWTPLAFAVRDFFANGGREAVVLALRDDGGALTAGELLGEAGTAPGLRALETAGAWDLLCVPAHTPDGGVAREVLAAAMRLCERRRAFLLVDPPPAWSSPAGALAGVGALPRSASAAVYFPAVGVGAQLGGARLERLGPCGAVAGMLARTDAELGIWKVPRGRVELPAPTLVLREADVRSLSERSINCLRDRPDVGLVIWGARTLAPSDAPTAEWRYVPVRRLVAHLEESVERGTAWAASEPNGEPLWTELRAAVENLLFALWRQGAFAGATPEESFFVSCDASTMTQDDMSRARVVVLFGVAPIRPGEFVISRIVQTARGEG